jgi:hypothetical protein
MRPLTRTAPRSWTYPAHLQTLQSEHWYDGFNPRCRDCRALGGPCEVALRFMAGGAQ